MFSQNTTLSCIDKISSMEESFQFHERSSVISASIQSVKQSLVDDFDEIRMIMSDEDDIFMSDENDFY